MNLKKIKGIYKSLPNSLSFPLRYIPFEVFCGSIYRKTIKDIENYKELDDLKKECDFHRRVINYLNESISNTKFYKDFARSKKISRIENIEQYFTFPIVTKEQLSQDLDWFVDNRYNKKSYKVSTGGTTGKQTELLMSNDAFAKEWAFVNSFLSEMGVDINSRRLCLRGVDGIKNKDLIGYNNLYKEMLISPFRLSSELVALNQHTINAFQAKWIHGYPSSVCEFAKQINNTGLEIKTIEHVLLVSEAVYSEQLEAIKAAFNSKVLTFYGMSERVVFAPKINDIFQPCRFYGATEEVNGQLVSTGFINSATRLIRYETGDAADVVKDEYGFVKSISSLRGRWGKEYLLGFKNEKITMTALNTHDDILNSVRRYQFFQDQKGHAKLLLESETHLSQKQVKNITDVFQKKLGNALNLEGVLVDKIELTARGKHKFIVSKICT